ncbi:MAG: Rpn family recombination-promoting nuclease/putative transposase [Scytonematopsis contorta HA4267-MV1]|jgi:predicted transposase/invertase (TIGR01784 family)|nr:Rpn family recombination-promoting nuclease/putative transposase [Scytonematopsis contorta HA4267-MV1]
MLIARANQQSSDAKVQKTLIELIETIIVYKFPDLTRQEIEDMLRLSDLKKTKVYQEAFEEGSQQGEQRGEQRGELKMQLQIIPRLLSRGLSIEEIAEITGLEVEQVCQATNQQ